MFCNTSTSLPCSKDYLPDNVKYTILRLPLKDYYCGLKTQVTFDSNKHHEITIPPYSRPNQILYYQLKDSYLGVILELEPHSLFSLEGYDLVLRLDLSVNEAQNGFEHFIEFLNGQALVIHRNKLISSNEEMVFPNYGLYNEYQNKYGNLVVKFNIIFEPEVVTSELPEDDPFFVTNVNTVPPYKTNPYSRRVNPGLSLDLISPKTLDRDSSASPRSDCSYDSCKAGSPNRGDCSYDSCKAGSPNRDDCSYDSCFTGSDQRSESLCRTPIASPIPSGTQWNSDNSDKTQYAMGRLDSLEAEPEAPRRSYDYSSSANLSSPRSSCSLDRRSISNRSLRSSNYSPVPCFSSNYSSSPQSTGNSTRCPSGPNEETSGLLQYGSEVYHPQQEPEMSNSYGFVHQSNSFLSSSPTSNKSSSEYGGLTPQTNEDLLDDLFGRRVCHRFHQSPITSEKIRLPVVQLYDEPDDEIKNLLRFDDDIDIDFDFSPTLDYLLQNKKHDDYDKHNQLIDLMEAGLLSNDLDKGHQLEEETDGLIEPSEPNCVPNHYTISDQKEKSAIKNLNPEPEIVNPAPEPVTINLEPVAPEPVTINLKPVAPEPVSSEDEDSPKSKNGNQEQKCPVM